MLIIHIRWPGRYREELKLPRKEYNGGNNKMVPDSPDSPLIFLNYSLASYTKSQTSSREAHYPSKVHLLITAWCFTHGFREKILCSPYCTLFLFLAQAKYFLVSLIVNLWVTQTWVWILDLQPSSLLCAKATKPTGSVVVHCHQLNWGCSEPPTDFSLLPFMTGIFGMILFFFLSPF